MTLLRALDDVIAFLEEQEVPYAVIGGLAVQHWGEPRMTRDVDITVMVPAEREEAFLHDATLRFRPRVQEAVTFARRNRVLLVSTAAGVPVDLSLGIPGYEEEVVRRTVTVRFPGIRPVRLVSAEDLIIHKCVAGRPRDQEDIERILVRQRLSPNLAYIRRWLGQFAPLVNTHDASAVLEEALKRARAALAAEGSP